MIQPRLLLARAGVWVWLTKADVEGRARDLVFLGFLGPWFAYTALYFFLHPRGLTASASLFMWLTGRPDPACGLTRTFAWMWRGDVRQAILVYPLGPLVFLLTVLVAGYALVALPVGYTVRVRLAPRALRILLATAGIAVAANWLSKLLWLGM